MESSFLALNVEFGGFFQNFWMIFQDKGKHHQNRILKCLADAKWVDDYHSPFTPQIVQKCQFLTF